MAKDDVVARTTSGFQSALDAAEAAGGGEVVVPSGRHVCGTLRIGSNTTLVLSPGAVLAGSPSLDDYPEIVPQLRSYSDNYTRRSLLYAERAHRISVVGRGVIDGQGAAFLNRPYFERPYLMRMIECEDVLVRDVELRDSAMWVQHYLACRRVVVDAITVVSRCNINNDGIDIDSCSDFRLSNSFFDTEDDAVCLKATAPLPCTNVAVTNCVMTTDCNGFKIGTETVGDISDVALSNCTMHDIGLAAVAVESVDGAHVERISISQVTARRASAALFVRLAHRGRPWDAEGTADYYDEASSDLGRAPVGRVRDVRISGLDVQGCDGLGSSITGTTAVPVMDVSVTDSHWSAAGGGTDAPLPPEYPERYPEYRMFGALPAHGLFARHVQGLALRDLFCTTELTDERPPIVLHDVDLAVPLHPTHEGERA